MIESSKCFSAKSGSPIPCQDPFGNSFENLSQMCRHWSIPISSLQKKLNSGWTMQQIIAFYQMPEEERPCNKVNKEVKKYFSCQKITLLRGWGLATQDIFPISKKISLDKIEKKKLTPGQVQEEINAAKLCPRVSIEIAINRRNAGFSIRDSVMSPRAFLRIVKERFGC